MGYTACDRTDLGDPAGGCGADRVEALPFWAGWGAVAVAVVLTVLLGYALRFPGRPRPSASGRRALCSWSSRSHCT
ncbi:hypothetical protein NKG94_50015 [Micromonospora sp. M12]